MKQKLNQQRILSQISIYTLNARSLAAFLRGHVVCISKSIAIQSNSNRCTSRRHTSYHVMERFPCFKKERQIQDSLVIFKGKSKSRELLIQINTSALLIWSILVKEEDVRRKRGRGRTNKSLHLQIWLPPLTSEEHYFSIELQIWGQGQGQGLRFPIRKGNLVAARSRKNPGKGGLGGGRGQLGCFDNRRGSSKWLGGG